MKKTLIFILVVLALAAIGALVHRESRKAPSAEGISAETGAKLYSNSTYGLSFSYPAKYYLEEREENSAQRIHHEIVLTEDTEWNRKLRSGAVPPTEGPTSITIDVFQNDLDRQSAYSFVTGTSFSNYKLGDGKLSTTTRGSLEGLEYSWSGLYEGRSYVVSTPAYVYMFSVTRMDPTDRILADFNGMLDTVKIE